MAISGYDLRSVVFFLREGDVTSLSDWDEIKEEVCAKYPSLKLVLDRQDLLDMALERIADKILEDADAMIAKEETCPQV